MLAAFLIAPAAASARDRCCFRVQATASGTSHTLYAAPTAPDGFAVPDAAEGRYDIGWSWTVRYLAQYEESDDRRRVPFLRYNGLGRRNRTSPQKLRLDLNLRDETCYWEAPSEPDGQGRRSQVCDRSETCPNDYRLSTNGRFVSARPEDYVDFDLVSGQRMLAAGHHVALLPNPGGDVTETGGDLCQAPDGWHGSQSAPSPHQHEYLLGEPSEPGVFGHRGGPWRYWLELPPPTRRDFRSGARFSTENRRLSFDHTHEQSRDPEKRRHTTTASSEIQIRFAYFPERKLRREIRALNRLR